MEKSTRLHLGSGRHYWPGFINIDAVGRCDANYDLKCLPYADNSVEMIYAIHLFEHLERMEVNEYLQEWKRVLKHGGNLVLEMPCLDKMAQMIVDGEENIRLTLLGIFGDPREPDKKMRHLWAYTRKELTEILQENGFKSEITEPVYHLPARDMRLTATKES